MTKLEEHINGLIELKADLQAQINKIDIALSGLTGITVHEIKSDTPEQNDDTPRKRYPKYKLDKLISQGYQHNWKNPEKIMWFLKTFGKKMYIKDMVEMTYKLIPELTKDQLDKIERKLGYQAGIMAKDGMIGMEKEGVSNIYWLLD